MQGMQEGSEERLGELGSDPRALQPRAQGTQHPQPRAGDAQRPTGTFPCMEKKKKSKTKRGKIPCALPLGRGWAFQAQDETFPVLGLPEDFSGIGLG